jgi:hypothetical protein
MTDTARTLAAIKALLADNTTENISPQDVRDAIESIANPVDNGGLGPVMGGYFGTPSDPGNVTITGTPTMPRIPMTYAAPNANENPGGWWNNTPYVSAYWDITFPQTFLLPPGFYLWNMYADFGAAGYHVNTDSSTLDAFLAHADDPSDLDWVHGGRAFNDPVYTEGLYKPGIGTTGDNAEGHTSQGITRVPRLDNFGVPVTTQRFGAIYRLKDQTSIVTGYRNLTIVKLT